MAGVIGAVSQCRAAHSPLSHLSTSSGHCQSASSSNILRTACRRLTDFTSLRSCRSLAGFSQSSPQIYWGCVKSRGARIYEYSSNWIQKRGVILHISQLVDVVIMPNNWIAYLFTYCCYFRRASASIFICDYATCDTCCMVSQLSQRQLVHVTLFAKRKTVYCIVVIIIIIIIIILFERWNNTWNL